MDDVNTRKSGNFSALLYREWVFSKKPFLYSLIIFAIVATLSALVLASTKVGNLAKLPAEAMEIAGEMIPAFVFLLPPFMTSVLISASTETSALHDEQVMWKRFRLASPVKPAKFALAKSVMLIISLAVAIGLGFAYIAIIRGVNGEPFSVSDAGYLMTFYAVTTVVTVLIQIMTMLFHSAEKATMAVFIPVILIGLGLSMAFGEKEVKTEVIINTLKKICTGFLPFAPFVIIAIVPIHFKLLTMLIARREK